MSTFGYTRCTVYLATPVHASAPGSRVGALDGFGNSIFRCPSEVGEGWRLWGRQAFACGSGRSCFEVVHSSVEGYLEYTPLSDPVGNGVLETRLNSIFRRQIGPTNVRGSFWRHARRNHRATIRYWEDSTETVGRGE